MRGARGARVTGGVVAGMGRVARGGPVGNQADDAGVLAGAVICLS